MPNKNIDAIKQTEAEALARIDKVRQEAEESLREAEKQAEELIHKRQHEAREEVLRMKVEAEEAAIAQAARIRTQGERKVEALKKQRQQRLPIAVKSIMMQVLGEEGALSANDETGMYRVSPGVPE